MQLKSKSTLLHTTVFSYKPKIKEQTANLAPVNFVYSSQGNCDFAMHCRSVNSSWTRAPSGETGTGPDRSKAEGLLSNKCAWKIFQSTDSICWHFCRRWHWKMRTPTLGTPRRIFAKNGKRQTEESTLQGLEGSAWVVLDDYLFLSYVAHTKRPVNSQKCSVFIIAACFEWSLNFCFYFLKKSNISALWLNLIRFNFSTKSYISDSIWTSRPFSRLPCVLQEFKVSTGSPTWSRVTHSW